VMEFEYPAHIQQPHIESVVNYFRGSGKNPCSLEEAAVVMSMMDSTLENNSVAQSR